MDEPGHFPFVAVQVTGSDLSLFRTLEVSCALNLPVLKGSEKCQECYVFYYFDI
mgnify:CR=1 FL=1